MRAHLRCVGSRSVGGTRPSFGGGGSSNFRKALATKRELTPEIENQLKQVLKDFKEKAWKK